MVTRFSTFNLESFIWLLQLIMLYRSCTKLELFQRQKFLQKYIIFIYITSHTI